MNLDNQGYYADPSIKTEDTMGQCQDFYYPSMFPMDYPLKVEKD